MPDFIRFLGTGPAKPIFKRGKNKRQQTSTLFCLKGRFILIDASPAVQKQAKWLKKDVPPEEKLDVFLTHAHSDAIGGMRGLETIARNARWQLAWHAHEHTFAKQKPEGNTYALTGGQGADLNNVSVTPFLVEHVTSGKPVPTFGFYIQTVDTSIAYCIDIAGLTPESEKYFKKAKLIIIDGSGWDKPVINHHAVKEFVARAAAWEPQHIIVTHIGRNVPPHNKAQKILRKIFPNTTLAYDGLLVNLVDGGIKKSKHIN